MICHTVWIQTVCKGFTAVNNLNHRWSLSHVNFNLMLETYYPDQDRHSVDPDLDPNCLQRLSTDNNFRHRWGLTPHVNFTLILETYYLSFNNKRGTYNNTFLSLIMLHTVILCSTLLSNFCPISLQDFSNFLHALSRLKQCYKPCGS